MPFSAISADRANAAGGKSLNADIEIPVAMIAVSTTGEMGPGIGIRLFMQF